jgi:alkanesulfonate monooxygenase SsuD/methylene tetrahydromethanopterin reductase-like flavin-dependent oxidoreductase (luciferase family)
MLMRRLLDGERFSHEGPAYTFHDALVAPRPIQAHLPILIGGSGPKKTLRTVAERADAWNTAGTVEEVATRLEILAEHGAAVGRDVSTIEKTISFPIILRDDATAAAARFRELLDVNGVDELRDSLPLLGSPEFVADAIRPYQALGFETVISRMPAPYDRETIDRMAEVSALLDA